MKDFGKLLDAIIGEDQLSPFVRAVYIIGKIAAGVVTVSWLAIEQQFTTDPRVSQAMGIGLLVLMITGTLLGFRYLSIQPKSSKKRVVTRLLVIFLVIPALLTAIIYAAGYFFHAPGINPE